MLESFFKQPGKNEMGKNVVVLGTQWGDEGKGKIVDLLTERAKYVVRYHARQSRHRMKPELQPADALPGS